MKRLLLISLLLLALPALAGDPQLSPNAPKDKPSTVAAGQLSAFEAAIAPYIAQAKATYPEAKAKFLAGLPDGQIFFLTTRLHDSTGAFEQVFVYITAIENGVVKGRIASEIMRVSGYRNGDSYSFPESDMVDWLIAHPDGTEEGNIVGKFLDGYTGDGA